MGDGVKKQTFQHILGTTSLNTQGASSTSQNKTTVVRMTQAEFQVLSRQPLSGVSGTKQTTVVRMTQAEFQVLRRQPLSG